MHFLAVWVPFHTTLSAVTNQIAATQVTWEHLQQTLTWFPKPILNWSELTWRSKVCTFLLDQRGIAHKQTAPEFESVSRPPLQGGFGPPVWSACGAHRSTGCFHTYIWSELLYYLVWSEPKWPVCILPWTRILTEQPNLGLTKRGGLSPNQTEPDQTK